MADLDPMDARLREYAERWRDAAAPAPAVDPSRLRHGWAFRRAWALVVASAAAVAAVIVGATTLVGGEPDTEPQPPLTTPTGSTTPGAVVPWAPLPATHPSIPTQTTPASPDPAEAAGKPECRAADLRAENDGTDGAGGTVYLNVRLVLAGTSPCRLEGWPDIVPMDNGRPVDIPTKRLRDSSNYDGPVLVSPDRPAVLFLGWASNWCTAAVHNDTLRLVLPGGSVDFRGFGDSPFCNGIPGSGPTPILVQPFLPEKFRQAHVRSAYAHLQVSGDLQLTAAAGEEVHFTVTLTSPTDLVLDPCPDYRFIENSDSGTREEAYALNCAAVPYRDRAGRPYLPAGTPVPFDMVLGPVTESIPKLGWELEVPERKGTGGQLALGTPTPAAGTRVSVRTHCGVVSLWVGKVLWLADPPLRDDSGNPPPGWDENSTSGLFVVTGADTATFYGDGGQAAQFRRAPDGTVDPGAGCE